MLIEQWQLGRFPFERMIKRYPLDSIDQAFADCASGAAVKPVLDIGA
jgi:aryl-alcohol dehydrogenase